MSTNRSALLDVISRFEGTEILVIGDLLLDHYIWGRVERISPEAPVVVVRQTAESKRLGGAGNVVHNLTALGAKVSVCGIVGDDDSGRALLSMLEEQGVGIEGVLIDRSRPTTVKTRVIAHAQQVVRVDRETTEPISEIYQESVAAHFQIQLAKTKGVVISDYAKGTICRPLFQRIEKGYREGLLGRHNLPVLVDPKAPNFPLYTRATVIKPNRREAQDASGVMIKERQDALQAGHVLLEKWNAEMVLITLGEMGMALVSMDGGEPQVDVEVDTVAREVYDVSGAGDTVSAVFLLALAVQATPSEAAALANAAAGIVVGEVGTVAVKLEELNKAFA